ncbi:cobyric acid synthase [Sphingobium baderi]|uniref:Cobyric acid synthase n=1 Tax=Sphingobium baderi TaxID=1332080 RepID=A0A0S3EWB7_9SPHN|nr:cobyric acid synthase [Sphingobium baderi]ALR19720.1 cobalamin biosynthesis protein CobQ [Sphingobium baderi]
MGAVMLQGTGSDVGKSVLVAGLCRALVKRGLRVLPFKPQNMSNNAAVTSDGGEIGRAQALQAIACGVAPHTDMNPVLLKPSIIDPADAAMIEGFIINKFRGDPALFADGYAQIESLSGWRGFGVVPWLNATARLPSEDAVVLERDSTRAGGSKLIACPILPRISNFDDLDPLKLEEGIELHMVPPGQPIPAESALIILPGSKATIADLATLRGEGWDIDILGHHRRGGLIMGLCGGYQMLGKSIADPDGLEGPACVANGLGLLDVETHLHAHKALRPVSGIAMGAPFQGYEMHMGQTSGPDTERPFARFSDGRRDGAVNAAGTVFGSYVHGLLADAGLRHALLSRMAVEAGGVDYGVSIKLALDEIAFALEEHLDIDALMALAKAERSTSGLAGFRT